MFLVSYCDVAKKMLLESYLYDTLIFLIYVRINLKFILNLIHLWIARGMIVLWQML